MYFEYVYIAKLTVSRYTARAAHAKLYGCVIEANIKRLHAHSISYNERAIIVPFSELGRS